LTGCRSSVAPQCIETSAVCNSKMHFETDLIICPEIGTEPIGSHGGGGNDAQDSRGCEQSCCHRGAEECRYSAPNRGLLSHAMRTLGNDVSGLRKLRKKRSAFPFRGRSGGKSREACDFFPVTFVPGRGIFRHS
jgi:hypothetical protein